MSSFDIFDIASMAISAQSFRLNASASNIANEGVVAGTEEEAYHAVRPGFKTVDIYDDPFSEGESLSKSVKVEKVESSRSLVQKRYDPSHPKADQDGYIYQTNVNVVQEMADVISASRSLQTNAQVFNAAKEMMQHELNLGK